MVHAYLLLNTWKVQWENQEFKASSGPMKLNVSSQILKQNKMPANPS